MCGWTQLAISILISMDKRDIKCFANNYALKKLKNPTIHFLIHVFVILWLNVLGVTCLVSSWKKNTSVFLGVNDQNNILGGSRVVQICTWEYSYVGTMKLAVLNKWPIMTSFRAMDNLKTLIEKFSQGDVQIYFWMRTMCNLEVFDCGYHIIFYNLR